MKTIIPYNKNFVKLITFVNLFMCWFPLQAQVDANWVRQHAETTQKAYEEGNRNKAKLMAEGNWNLNKMPGTVYLRTPIERMPNMHEYGFYHIPYTPDDDPSSNWKDAWCVPGTVGSGVHTYDGITGTEFRLAGGYNVINEKIGRVTAAADGIIVAKADGNFDMNCYGTTGPDNFIALEHADGTRTYYYNLKNGDQNQKPIGEIIREGEWIGYPGGSGTVVGLNQNENSRLFFELRDNANNVINPFDDCGGVRGDRWKDSTNIRSYAINPSLLHLKTFKHAPINVDNCGTDIPNYTNHFNPGDSIFVEFAIKNYRLGDDSVYIDIYNPLGIPVVPTYLRPKNYSPHTSFLLNYWVPFVLPTGGLMVPGTYSVVLQYRSDIYSNATYYHYVTVGCQSNYTLTTPVNGEYGRIAGNNIYSSQICNSGSRVKYIAGNEIILTPGFIAYAGSYVMLYNEPCVVPPRMESPDESLISNASGDMTLSPNPAADRISIKIPGATSKTNIKIYNNTMQLLKSFHFKDGIKNTISTVDLSPGIYFVIAKTETRTLSRKLIIAR